MMRRRRRACQRVAYARWMTIDWNQFTPWASLAGGLLLGLAAALFILLNGRVLGISGILGGLLRPRQGDTGWRLAFLAGLLLAPALWSLFAAPVAPRFPAGPAMLVLAGLLVGWGTREGSGCTSGHGVCGLARLSPRSLVATLAFMASGFASVFVVRHVLA
ncbi:MAG: sulfur transport family protein [Ramlibacter sp.]|nr:sulfur transport family protein [Ramlibacter sp.]